MSKWLDHVYSSANVWTECSIVDVNDLIRHAVLKLREAIEKLRFDCRSAIRDLNASLYLFKRRTLVKPGDGLAAHFPVSRAISMVRRVKITTLDSHCNVYSRFAAIDVQILPPTLPIGDDPANRERADAFKRHLLP